MLHGVIDAGSNTFRLLLGKVENNRPVPIRHERRICRLAGGSTPDQGLTPEAMDRALRVLKEFLQVCQEAEVKELRAVGTAAFRQAPNGRQFAADIQQSLGLSLHVLSGKEEAELSAAGVLSAVSPLPGCALIIDIGGGSTELILCLEGQMIWSESLPLGVVHLSEHFPDQVARQNHIAQTLAPVVHNVFENEALCKHPSNKLTVIGTAGTVTTLAALDMQMAQYDWRRVNNYSLSADRLNSWYDYLHPLTPEQREDLPGMEAGRGDVIVPGLEIVLKVLACFDCDRLVVSDFGILEGALLAQYHEMKYRSFR